MILIDKPYVSDFLIKTLKKNNFPVIASKEATELLSNNNNISWISEKDAISHFKKNPKALIYTNSENAIGWIEENLGFTALPQKIQLFKNKIKFRELIKEFYPDFFFKGVKWEELKNISVHHLNYPFIVKPAVGFFSIGVHKVDNAAEWPEILDKLEKEISNLKSGYPKEVIDVSEFIIEQHVEGEEYAIDCYFKDNGEPVILNILHHIFSSEKDVSDRVYSTSENIIKKYFNPIENFLIMVGKKAALKNVAIHVEVRINKEGKIIPIEINPLRFGGWCTTGDLSWFAYGINSYESFLKGKKPDWNEIFKTRKGKKYSLILLDNNSGIPSKNIQSFDYDLLLKDFKKPLELRKTNYKDYPIFGFLFIETTAENEKELTQILTSNLTKYIKT